METALIILVIVFILAPAAVIYLEGKYNILKKIGAVLVCYGIGLAIGNMGVLPEGSAKYQDLLTQITIPLALPLILFSMDVKKWFANARSAFVSLLIGLVSVLIVIFIGFWIYNGKIDNIWQVSGMLVGIYTGGTPNMAAIKEALGVSQELYIMTHTYEMSLGALYLIFVLSIGQRVLLWILPAYKSPVQKPLINIDRLEIEEEEDFESYDGILQKKYLVPLTGAFGLSVLILGVSYGISMFVPADYKTAVIILLITTFGILSSFVPKIKNIKKTFQLGMYLILIFSITVASMADVSKLANISFSLFYYVGLAMFGSHFLHIMIAKIFKIDADTVLISGSALICSPPFVPVVAGALKNREIVLTGLIVGIAGYAVGNYLGIAVAYILK